MYKRILKRSLDILLSIIGLPFFLLFLIMFGLAIKISDKGPVFYNAPRLGKNGKIFKMFKFRSMKVNAPDIRNPDGSTFNSEEDPRLTRVGKFIRKTSIDELPQIINILKGEMSFIGPRPDLPEHIEIYVGNDIRKLEVCPGITGYSQAYFRNSISFQERLRNDIYYIDHLTFMMDCKVFFKTIVSILGAKNIYVVGTLTPNEKEVDLQKLNNQ